MLKEGEGESKDDQQIVSRHSFGVGVGGPWANEKEGQPGGRKAVSYWVIHSENGFSESPWLCCSAWDRVLQEKVPYSEDITELVPEGPLSELRAGGPHQGSEPGGPSSELRTPQGWP